MPKESLCLKIPKKSGERAKDILSKLCISDKKLLITQVKTDMLCIPLIRMPTNDELAVLKAELSGLDFDYQFFSEKNNHGKTITELLKDKLPPHLFDSVPRALDIIGDIAIIEIPPALEPYKVLVGEAVLKIHRNLKTVLAKVGAISGVYRLRSIEYLVGENKTTTVHKEYGCSYYVDVAKTYFSPRLSNEHWRVASLVKPRETIVDMFAGVGPFAIPIAKSQPTSKIYAIDINPDAIDLMNKNLRINKVQNVIPVLGNALEIVNAQLSGIADRVIMNLPETAYEFVNVACKAIKSDGGIIHFYGFLRTPDTMEAFQQRFKESVEKANRKVTAFECIKTVRETAPYEYQVVIDSNIL